LDVATFGGIRSEAEELVVVAVGVVVIAVVVSP